LFIAPSIYLKEKFEQSNYSNIYHLPYFIETFKETQYNIKNKNSIIFCGRLIKEKGVIYLIKAFERINNKNKKTKLIIIGEGPEENNLKEYIKTKKIKNVIFQGFVDNKELIKFYQNSAFLVIPSILTENYPIVALEAMSNSIPVIAFDSGGVKESVINNKTGLIIKKYDIVELTRKMDFLIENKSIAKKMGIEGYNFIRRLNKEDYYKNLVKIYNKIIK